MKGKATKKDMWTGDRFEIWVPTDEYIKATATTRANVACSLIKRDEKKIGLSDCNFFLKDDEIVKKNAPGRMDRIREVHIHPESVDVGNVDHPNIAYHGGSIDVPIKEGASCEVTLLEHQPWYDGGPTYELKCTIAGKSS